MIYVGFSIAASKLLVFSVFKNLILHIFSHNYHNYSMFLDVPECSMFLLLPTTEL